MTNEERFMKEAIALSKKSIEQNEGGPFGCIIVRNNEIIARGNNRVLVDNDPTAHAEVVAIRNACRHVGTFQLENCEIYSSCEPCPMCLGAIYWARPRIVFFANTRQDAASIGFDDSMIYQEMGQDLSHRKIPVVNLCRQEALKVFAQWAAKQDKTLY
ncbi:MAG: nucleoside deaminase [Bacteroidota bacterium]|nr:nucleoside deaminase [Bacteroidota bacterium]